MGCFDGWKHFSTGLASLVLVAVAAIACDDAEPAEDGGPSPSPSDASIDRADASAVDSSSDDASAEGGPFADAATDAQRDERSSEDRQSDDRSADADTSLDGDDGATRGADADATPDGGVGTDANGAADGDVALDGVDALDADTDGGCECTVDDTGGIGNLPLECLCGSGQCLGYDAAMNECPRTPFPEDHRLDTYPDCNLVVIHIANGIGIGGTTYVYDATTHELVGAAGSGDYPGSRCGSTQVFGYRGGTFPPPTCARTQSIPRCGDGGDGG